MARRDFYSSSAWLKCREGFIASVFGLCNRCKHTGYIVHHKIPITDDNEDDPEITLNWENLEYLCLECHNKEHFGGGITEKGTKFDENGQLISTNTPPYCHTNSVRDRPERALSLNARDVCVTPLPKKE